MRGWLGGELGRDQTDGVDSRIDELPKPEEEHLVGLTVLGEAGEGEWKGERKKEEDEAGADDDDGGQIGVWGT